MCTSVKKYMCDLVFEYNYEKEIKEELYDEKNELKIIKYTTI